MRKPRNTPAWTSGPRDYDNQHAMTDPEPETVAEGDAQAPVPKRFLFLRRRDPASATDGSGAEDAPPPAPAGADEGDDADGDRVRPGVLKRRRRQLMAQYEQGIFDLGGLAMELHARGLLAEDVMRRRAAEVADIRSQVEDLGAQLEELRQERKERRHAGRGSSIQCPACGVRSRAGANFCAACGAALAPDTSGDGGDQPTTVIAEEQVTTVVVDEQVTTVIADDPQPTAAIPPQDESGA